MAQEEAIRPDTADPESLYWTFKKLLDVTKYFRAYCYQSVTDLGFSRNEIDVLVSLNDHPECNTVKGISETVHLSKGMISQAVESLRQRQYITVGTDENDRRSLLISLTAMAQPVLDRIKESYTAFVEKIFHGIPNEQMKDIFSIVTQVYSNKEQMKAPKLSKNKEKLIQEEPLDGTQL